jgi:hypothetical protein
MLKRYVTIEIWKRRAAYAKIYQNLKFQNLLQIQNTKIETYKTKCVFDMQDKEGFSEELRYNYFVLVTSYAPRQVPRQPPHGHPAPDQLAPDQRPTLDQFTFDHPPSDQQVVNHETPDREAIDQETVDEGTAD